MNDFVTDSGIPVAPVYRPPHETDYEGRIGDPGSPPYVRGIHPTMYRGRPWTIRQLSGYGAPEDTNIRHRLLLTEGATGVNTVFDYPTNRGYDSDDPFAVGDAGQGGVAVDSIDDMVTLYEAIPLDEVSVSVVLSHPVAAPVIFAMYLVAAERRGYNWERLRGTLQNDFLMETVILTAPNTLRPEFSFKLSMDVVEFCIHNVPQWNPVSWTGYNYREAGANAVQEVALLVANAVATVQEMTRRGYEVDDYAPRLSGFFTADNDFFEEVAKFRAARRIYWRTFEHLGARNPRSGMLRYHVQTSGSALTAQQPLNNITRAAYHALAAVLGGAQSLHVSGYDEALSIPTELAALTAMRTQQILLRETGVTRTVDPLAGSFFVEQLTDEMDRRITEYMDQIAKRGGLVAAVNQGWVHAELIENAYLREASMATGERQVVGVNAHDLVMEGDDHEIFRIPETVQRQRQKLERLRSTRDEAAVTSCLEAIRNCIEDDANVMPAVLDAVRAGATLGECCGIFRELRGNWRQPLFG